MKKSFFLLAILFRAILAFAQQKNYSADEIKRLADLGRIWGMVNYFHPVMGNGTINTAALVVSGAAALANDPSAANFKLVVNNMLSQLNDPTTNIGVDKTIAVRASIFTRNNTAAVQRLTSGYWYIALPTIAVSAGDVTKVPGILPPAWDSAKGIIMDLRNTQYSSFTDMEFLYRIWPLINGKLLGNTQLPNAYERTVYHNGMVPQENGENNIYYSGWKTQTNITSRSQPGNTPGNAYNKPVAFVINENTSFELKKQLLQLRVANKCLLIYEGEKKNYIIGSITSVAIADGLTLHLRTSDLVFGNNQSAPLPDLTIASIVDFSENGSFLQQCTRLLDKGLQPGTGAATTLSLQYNIPIFTDTKTGFTVGTGERLLALYNHWNAIRYFFPYKHLLQKDWNTVLEEHIPEMIRAVDSVSYNYALRSMIAEIHDSHGSLRSTLGVTPMRYELGSWPAVDVKFVGDHLYITSIGADSLPGKNITLWDEVTAIDGATITQCLDKWRGYLATSNEATYKRDVAGTILAGKRNTAVSVTLNRKGKIITEILLRSGRYIPTGTPIDFNGRYPTIKMMDGNTGYVNMGALKQTEVDSMFTLFINTKAIIFDMRNYPKGTAWSIAPRLTTTRKQAVKFHYPFVTANNINGGEDDMMGESFFTVIPDTSKPMYKGKIIILCNATTQSQAEYSIMMYQGATDVTVIGSQTAGADGNVTDIVLPGNYRTSFSGLEVLYPDGGQTQRSGIRINIQSHPTVKGLQAGKDEVLERAMEYAKNGK